MERVSIILEGVEDLAGGGINKTPLDIVPTAEAVEIFQYIQNPDPESKQRLIEKYEPMLRDAVNSCIEIIQDTKQDPAYKLAFTYDEAEEYRKLGTGEITPDEFRLNPTRKEFHALIERLDDIKIAIPLTYLQILKYHQKSPGKRVTGKMADAIAAQLKHIHKQTAPAPGLLVEIAEKIGLEAMQELFIAYRHEHYLEARRRGYNAAIEQNNIMQAIKEANPDNPDTRSLINLHQEQFKKAAETMGDTWRTQSDLFNETGIPQRIDQLMIELYPTSAPLPDLPIEPGAFNPLSPFYLPNTQAAKYTYMALNAPDRMASTKPQEVTKKRDPLTGAHSVNIKTSDTDLLFIFTGELSNITNGPKLFTFFLSKALAQHWPDDGIKFNLAELVDIGIYADKESAYRGLENSVIKMQDIDIGGTVTGYEGRKRKQIRNVGGALISWRDITFNQCIIKLPPIYNAGYIPLMPITDPNYYKLPNKAFMLHTYIMNCARQSATAQKIKRNGYFTISMDSIRIHLGLPTIEEAGKDPKRLIVDPIDKALGEIMDSAGRDGLKIEIVTPYDQTKARPPASDYLNGYISIKLDETSEQIITERAGERSKKIELAIKSGEKKRARKS